MGTEVSRDKFFFAVAGNIGSGKTTLTKKLCESLNWKPCYESVQDNPYLEDFYHDMTRWSFPLQIYFLTHRFNTHREIERLTTSHIQDRSIYEDAHVFARALFEQGHMSERDYENYLSLYHSMIPFLKPPCLIIYLKRSIPKLMERIRMRGRDFEKGITVDYLERLNFYYDEWFDTYNQGKVLLVETDDKDFLSNDKDFLELVSRVQQHTQSSLSLPR